MSETPTTIYVQWSDDGQHIRKWSHEPFDGGIAFVAADTIADLRAEVERLTVNGIHTCHDQCQRPNCVLRREVEMVRAELAEARETIIAFAGPWVTQHARDYGLPDGHLHPMHYDILAKAGARMDDFTRAALSSITGDE